MVKLKEFVSRDGMIGSGALVFAASMVLSVGGFLFHAYASRKLGVADYGALGALISLYLIAALPASLFAPVIVKITAEFQALHDDAHVRGLTVFVMRAFGGIGLAYIVVSVVFASQLGDFLHVPRWGIPVVGVMVAIGLVGGALRAIGQGTHDFVGYARSAAGEGIAKIVALALLATLGLTIFRGSVAFALGLLVGAIVVAMPIVRRYGRIKSAPIQLDWTRIWLSSAAAAAAVVTTNAMGNADVIVVKHFFPATEAGLYTAAVLGGKIMLYFVGFVPLVLLPQASVRHARQERTRDALWMAVLFIAIICSLGVVFYHFFGSYILYALVGPAFSAAQPLMTGYAAAMGLLALTGALSSYGIATHRLGFALPLVIATFATLGVIAVVHVSLAQVVAEMVIGNAAMAAIVGASLGLQAKRAR